MTYGSAGISCTGTASAGALTNLIALGASDQYLTANPTITFFRYRYNKHTNFAMEAIEQPFNTQVAFGSDVQVTLNRNGDLIYFMYVVIDLPAIKAADNTQAVCGIGSPQFPCGSPCDPCGDGAAPNACDSCCPTSSAQADDFTLDNLDTCTGLTRPWAHWTNAVGQYLVKRACIVVGGQVVATLYNDFLYMWEELAGKPGKRLTEMIGKRYTRAQLVADSQEDRRLYVPLPFWFTRTSGNTLPMASLQFHGIQVHICFSDLLGAVQVSDCGVLVLKCGSCQPLTNNDLSARLLTSYVYLDVPERNRFATGSFEQLIDQVQAYFMTARSSQVRLILNFNHPIIELMWAVRRKCQSMANNHFNYSGKYMKDPVKVVHCRLNNQPRFSGREGRYYRLVQPFQHHSLIPESFVYSYSFALHPEEPQPSGSMNASRIDNVELILELQDELADEDVEIMVFGRNWNVFRYREGLGGTAFSN